MSKQNLHNVAGAAPFDKAAFDKTYNTKMCPELTAGMMRPKEEKRVQTLGAAQVETGLSVQPCVGMDCMWFQAVADQHGIPRHGQCGKASTPMALNQLGSILNEIHSRLYELGTKFGATELQSVPTTQ
jgi:hypothetical protein